ncbi:hypothetical protein JCM10207_008805 [Rhodosporidiobolus poonsookiae]
MDGRTPPVDAGKKKKPPACDRCKTKRVLCHPSAQGCPRCHEKGVPCTTTPVVRRKPQKKKDNLAELVSAAPPLVATPLDSLPFPPAVLAPPSAPTPSPPAPIPPTAQTPYASYATPVASTSQLPYGTLVVVPRVHVEVTAALAKHLFTCESLFPSSLISHPTFTECTLHARLEALGWNVHLLPLPSRALAYAIFAVSSLISFAPEIIGEHEPRPTSFADVALYPEADWRIFGQRRKMTCRALAAGALQFAKEADVLLEPTVENASTCMLMNMLANSDDLPPKSRPWQAAYLSHVRALAESNGTSEPLPINAVRWACYMCVESIADASEGRMNLTRADELLFVGGEPPEMPAYIKGLQHTLERPVDRTLWPDLKPYCLLFLKTARELTTNLLGAHVRRLPLDEHAVLQSLSALHDLHAAADGLSQIVLRLLDQYQPMAVNFFPAAIAGSGKIRMNRAGSLGAMRCLAIFTWTSLVLPLYREMRRRSQLNHQHRSLSFDSTSASQRLSAERVETYVRQARELCFLAVEPLAECLVTAPVTIVALNRRKTMEEWATFVVEELELGTVDMDDKTSRMVEHLVSILRHHSYVYSTTAIDNLVSELESRLYAYRLVNQPTLYEMPTPTFFNPPSQPDPSFPPGASSSTSFLATAASTPGAPADNPLNSASAPFGLPIFPDALAAADLSASSSFSSLPFDAGTASGGQPAFTEEDDYYAHNFVALALEQSRAMESLASQMW